MGGAQSMELNVHWEDWTYNFVVFFVQREKGGLTRYTCQDKEVSRVKLLYIRRLGFPGLILARIYWLC